MLKLEAIKKNAAIGGIEPGQVVRVVTTEPVGPDAVTIYYKTPDGRLQERMLFRTDEANLSLLALLDDLDLDDALARHLADVEHDGPKRSVGGLRTARAGADDMTRRAHRRCG